MSQMIDGPRKTFLAGETGGAFIRWYVSDASTSPPTVMIAGATQPSIGASEAAVLATGPVSLLLANASGTRKLVANGVITGGNNAYAAADGEVSSTGTILEGTALEWLQRGRGHYAKLGQEYLAEGIGDSGRE